MSKAIIRVTTSDTVTIPRDEYNCLIAASVQLDMILASKSSYGTYSDAIINTVASLREKAEEEEHQCSCAWVKEGSYATPEEAPKKESSDA